MNNVKKSREINMLTAPLGKNILLMALPLMATGILQQLFNACDVAVVGQFVSPDAMAAVGANTFLVGLFVNLFSGISLGTNVIIAHFIGTGNDRGIKKCVHTSVLFSLLTGVGLIAIGLPLARPLLTLISVPENVMDMALLYLRIFFIGMPAIMLYDFEAAIFRSVGDTKTPLVCLLISGILNVLLNVLFVLGFNMTVDGVAWATVISNSISAIWLFIILLRTKTRIRLEPKKLSIDRAILGQILKIGLPAGVQGAVFSLSNTIIQSAVNSLGSTVMAASAAAFNVEILAYFPINAFSQTITTFIGQNYGAGNRERCIKTMRIATFQCFVFVMLITIPILLFSGPILSLFNPSLEVINYGRIRLFIVMIPYFLDGTMELISGAMRGYGRSVTPAAIILITICGTRITWVYTVFAAHQAFDWLLYCYPVSWLAATVLLFIAYYRMLPKLRFNKEE